ncbi:MAG: hypothetical protein AAB268_11810 [Elusimicrobiota bacterium]
MIKSWLRLYSVVMLFSIVTFARAAAVNQNILVLEIVEENWDTLPGQFMEKHKLSIPPEYVKKRRAEGKDLWGCYEDEMSRLYGWDKSYTAEDIMRMPAASITPDTRVLIWWRTQYKGHYRCSEKISCQRLESLPAQIDLDKLDIGSQKESLLWQKKRATDGPGLVERSGEFDWYRSALPLEIQSFNADGRLFYKADKRQESLPAASTQMISDVTKSVLAKELKALGSKQVDFSWLVENKPEPYEFRTRLSIVNHGTITRK